ncbi:hypothetical protein GGI10_006211, partial [Coemansia sp. RSA 2530]
PAKETERSTTLIIDPKPTPPTTPTTLTSTTTTATDTKGKPTKEPIPNIVEVTKLPIPTDLPEDLPTDPDKDPGSDADTDVESEDKPSKPKPPTEKEKLNSTEGMSSTTKIIIGVVAGLAALGIGAFILYYFYFRKRQ